MDTIKLTDTESGILEILTGEKSIPDGAYNIRVNGAGVGRSDTENVQIIPKDDNPGIDIFVKPNVKGERVHIPVVVSQSGVQDMVYNDFFIGENSDVLIVAGCGIHNNAEHITRHNGIHTFHVGSGAKVKYIEKHYGEGDGIGKRILDPVTVIHLEKDSEMEMETVQIEGVDATKRVTKCDIADNAGLVISEKLMTGGNQTAITDFTVELNGADSRVNLMSRSVAKGNSTQRFYSVINGNNRCRGHSECDAIIMDNACVKAVPDVTANHVDAALIHEAAIGKIAGEQITKLMTLGISEEDAEKRIVDGFLR